MKKSVVSAAGSAADAKQRAERAMILAGFFGF
jgi:hypothetical protein